MKNPSHPLPPGLAPARTSARPAWQILLLTFVLSLLAFARPEARAVSTTEDFIESIGFCLRAGDYSDADWNNYIKPNLGASGVRYVRDGLGHIANPTMRARFEDLHNTYGIKLLAMCMPFGENILQDPANVPPIVELAKPYLLAVEGTNEPDYFWYDGWKMGGFENRWDQVEWYHSQIYNRIKAHPPTASVLVSTPAMAHRQTTYEFTTRNMPHDIHAWHHYNGRNRPNPDIHYERVRYPSDKPAYLTEHGYNLLYHATPLAQMKYYGRNIAYFFKYGPNVKTFLFVFGIHHTSHEDFGTHATASSPRPVYHHISEITALLREATWNSTTKTWTRPSFTPVDMAYVFQGNNDGLRTHLLQKSNGDYFLLAWLDVDSVSSTKTDLSQTRSYTLLLPQACTVTQHTFNDSGIRSATTLASSGVTSVSVNVADRLTIFQLTKTGSTTPANPIVSGAVYELEPACAPGKRLDVQNGADANTTNVRILAANNGASQGFQITHVGNNVYEFTPQAAHTRRLDVSGASSANGANVHLWQSNGGSAQRWKASPLGGDVYDFEPLCAPGKRLDVLNGSSSDGANVQIHEGNFANAQRWRLILRTTSSLVVSGSVYELEPLCAPGLRLEVRDGANANGANVRTWHNNGSDAQGWTFTSVGNGIYELAPFCAITRRLDVAGAGSADGTNVHLWQSTGGNAQRWKLIDRGDNVYDLEPQCALGKRLDVFNGSGTAGANVQIHTSNGANAQRWRLHLRHAYAPIYSGALYDLAPQCGPLNRLDVVNRDNFDGADVGVWWANQLDAQEWRVTDVGSGFHELAPQCAAGRRLEVAGSGSTNGTNVRIWATNNSSGQRWKLIHIGGAFYELEPQSAPGKRLDVNAASSAAGANVHLWQSLGNSAQRWRFSAR